MANIRVITKAIIKTHTTSEVTDEETRRYNICLTCDYRVPTFYFRVVPEERFPGLKGMKCKKCGCCLTYKVRSDDKCPESKW